MTSNAFFVATLWLGAASVPAPEPQSDATAKKVNSLLRTMASASEKTDRSNAAEELLRMGKTAVPALVAAVRHTNATIRYHAVAILGGMGAGGAAAVPELIRAAKSPKEDAGVRQRAIYSLGEVRAGERRCVPFLLETLQRGDPDLAELAGEALGKFGGKAKSAVPALVKMVQRRSKKLEVVVRVLGKIGPEAKAAIPALKALQADPKYEEIRPRVERALQQIQTERKRALAPTAPPVPERPLQERKPARE
jgi:HEAT repeat protein